MKVISWCLYINPDNKTRLPEYLCGLRCNQRAARQWFPTWNLRIYYNETVVESPEVKEFVFGVAQWGDPPIEMIPCRAGGANPMIERYRPFFDSSVSVCIVRDIDSILSKTDADFVNQWLENDKLNLFCYREYQMNPGWAMGGGVAAKTRIFQTQNFSNETKDESTQELKLYYSSGRSHDEPTLRKLIQDIPQNQIMEVITRMLSSGVYCERGVAAPLEPLKWVQSTPLEPLSEGAHAMIQDAFGGAPYVLWPVPFFDAQPSSMACNYPDYEYLIDADIAEIIEFCKNYRIRQSHTMSHLPHHREAIVEGWEWIR
jgi:hypothetical protein